MTKFTQIVLLGSALAVSAPLALAAPISGITGSIGIAGADNFTPLGITFSGTDYVTNTGGDLTAFQNGTPTLNSFSFATADNTTLFTVVTTTGTGPAQVTDTLSFDISSITWSETGSLIDVTGTGILSDNLSSGNNPYSPTAATFILQTNNDGTTSFALDGSAAVTPEPSSLLLLGTGLASAAGMMIRKRRILA